METIRVILFQYFIPILVAFLGLYLAAKTEIIKNSGDLEKQSYSFGRTQLLWWTIIILSCFSIYYGIHGDVKQLNPSSLILLGISLGTTTAAKIIDNTEINSDNVMRHQEKKSHEKKGFFHDILSDKNGISVHRFQAFIFNLIFGLMFIIQFASKCKYVDFGPMELTLMGISSAAYVGLKMNENGKEK